MKKNTIITISSIVLFLTGISQIVRIYYDLDIEITSKISEKSWYIPLWGSLLSAIITIFLAYTLVKMKKKR